MCGGPGCSFASLWESKESKPILSQEEYYCKLPKIQPGKHTVIAYLFSRGILLSNVDLGYFSSEAFTKMETRGKGWRPTEVLLGWHIAQVFSGLGESK